MQFRNPCKNCIISPMCQLICKPRDDLLNTWNKLGTFISSTIVILICIVLLLLLAFDPPKIYLRVCSIVLTATSIFSVFFQLIVKKIKKANKLRFGIIVTLPLRPIKPPPPPGPPPKRKVTI